MKIYFIDKTGRNLRLKSLIEKNGIPEIEVKNTYSFRTTKNDISILSEYREKDNENELLEKINNLIVITRDKSKELIFNLANKLKTIDIIYDGCGEEYIGQRIAKLIKQKM